MTYKIFAFCVIVLVTVLTCVFYLWLAKIVKKDKERRAKIWLK